MEHLKQPKQFNFQHKAAWPSWIERFEQFRIASGLADMGEEKQVTTLLCTMGPEANDVMKQLTLADPDRKKYAPVKAQFDAYFAKARNVIFEICTFRKRRQGEKEPVKAFITALYALSEYCEFGERREKEILLQLIIGIRDDRVSRRLQQDPQITLEAAVTTARQHEEISLQQSSVRSTAPLTSTQPISPSVSLEPVMRKPQTPKFVKTKLQQPRAGQTPKHWTPQRNSGQRNSSGCTRCGYARGHPRAECKASEARCGKCGKVGHFAKLCRSAAVIATAEAFDAPTETPFLGLLVTEAVSPWEADIRVDGTPTRFKIDTGADVTCVSERVYAQLGSPKLTPGSSLNVSGAGTENLEVVGSFNAQLSFEARSSREDVYVIRPLRHALLGKPALRSLGIIKRLAELLAATSSLDVHREFPSLFRGLGTMPGEYSIPLREGATPFALTSPRRVPLPLMDRVKAELQRMQSIGVITPVEEPTEWCSGMVVVPKSGLKVRVCVDLGKLNECVKRARLMIPAVDHVLAQLRGAKVFTHLDANSGFWQIPLAKESALLTTFITPFGRFCFNRLPFGITSAPEVFQLKMQQILSGLPGVVCMMDDCLVFGSTQSEHDERLRNVCKRLVDAGVTLNTDKCKFSVESVKFLGQYVDANGIRSDPDKVKAIQEMPAPQNVSDVRRFMGMVNHLGKFIPKLAELTEPLRNLLSKRNHWLWERAQTDAFDKIKRILASTTVLAHYNPQAETIVSADASSFGVGAVLLQRQDNGDLRPVAYASHSMTETQQRYAQIEKEAFALVWACRRFHDYLYGLPIFHAHTDHKPLVPLLSTSKRLDELPLRVQRFRIALARYNFTISHVPGKHMYLPDTLSRAPLPGSDAVAAEISADSDTYSIAFLGFLPATSGKIAEIKSAQAADPVCRLLSSFAKEGWPEKNTLQGDLKHYFPFSGEITSHEGLLLRGSRIIIPPSLRQKTLESLHSGHLGIVKCRSRAQESVWWPGLSEEISRMVNECEVCLKEKPNPVEPMIPSGTPPYPFHTIGTDLFEFKGNQYLLLVDYLSRYPEIALLESATSESVIGHLKSIFARYGIPVVVRSENGPQYASQAFADFAEKYDFQHITSSPKYPQSNGEAERMVKTIKEMLKKAEDPYLALLSYRSTPLAQGFSPAQILMGRRLRSNVPTTESSLLPEAIPLEKLRDKDEHVRAKQKEDFDRRHRVREMPTLPIGQAVYIPDRQEYGRVVAQASSSRSYYINTPTGSFRRNRGKLIPVRDDAASIPEDDEDIVIPELRNNPDVPPNEAVEDPPQAAPQQQPVPPQQQQQPPPVRTRSGRIVRPPARFADEQPAGRGDVV